MKKSNSKNKRSYVIRNEKFWFLQIGLLCIFVLEIFSSIMLFNQCTPNQMIQEDLLFSPTSAGDITTTQWLQNPNFTSSSNWIMTKTGDFNDTEGNLNNQQANFKVIGKNDRFSQIDNAPNSTWIPTLNPDFPTYPDYYAIRPGGLFANHTWLETADQSPSIHWEKNLSLPVNMTDYTITWANITSIVNATVKALGNTTTHSNRGIEVPGDLVSQNATYDYVRFYVLISNPSKSKKYEIAYYQTIDTGKDSAGNFDNLIDTYMRVVPVESLKIYLTDVLSEDKMNFTITLGMRIWCEDNWATDYDEFTSLYIKYMNLTIDYEKKINQGSSICWNQDGNKTPNNIRILNATLSLKYKTDIDWPNISSNAELRFSFNNIQIPNTIKLTSFSTDFQETSISVTNFISTNNDVNLSIIVYLADNFELRNNITFSVDDVVLYITFEDITPPISTEMQIFLDELDKTSDPQIIVPLGEILNITIKYTNSTFDPISNALIQLKRLGQLDNFTENNSLSQYSVSLNVTEDLIEGLNLVEITAQKNYYESLVKTIAITVRKIHTTISSTTNENITNIVPLDNASLSIKLYDDDFNETIKNATVSYSWTFGSGLLMDDDNDGIYLGTIINVPEGYHTINIKAIAEEKFSFNTFSYYINASNDLLIPTNYRIYLNNVEYSSDPSVELPINSNLNITVKYTTKLSEFIDNASVTLIRLGYLEDFTKIESLNQYSRILDVNDDLLRGLNTLTIQASKLGFTSNTSILKITIRKIDTQINTTTGSSILNIPPGIDTVIRVRVDDKDYNSSIKGLSLSYSWTHGTGLLTDANNDGIYEASLNEIPEGSFPILISAVTHENYTFYPLVITINSLPSLLENSEMIILVDGIVSTSISTINSPIGSSVNITIKYLDQNKGFISNARVRVQRGDIVFIIEKDPNFDQYTKIFDNDEDFTRGTNILSISSQKAGIQSQATQIQVNIRKITTQVSLISGINRIEIKPKEVGHLRVQLKNLDFNQTIKNVTVTYSWQFGQGQLTDEDNDGIYEVILRNVAEGSYPITITVYASDIYNFESYEITLSAQRTTEEIRNQQILLIGTVGGVVGLAGYLVMYQTRWKYPKNVREIRAIKKSLQKNQSKTIFTKSLSGAFTEKYFDQVKDFISNDRKVQLRNAFTPVNSHVANLAKSDVKTANMVDNHIVSQDYQSPTSINTPDVIENQEVEFQNKPNSSISQPQNEIKPNNELVEKQTVENTKFTVPSPKKFENKPQIKGLPKNPLSDPNTSDTNGKE